MPVAMRGLAGDERRPNSPPSYMGLVAGVVQTTIPVQAVVHEHPAELICAADIWNACRTSSRSIEVILGFSYRGRSICAICCSFSGVIAMWKMGASLHLLDQPASHHLPERLFDVGQQTTVDFGELASDLRGDLRAADWPGDAGPDGRRRRVQHGKLIGRRV